MSAPGEGDVAGDREKLAVMRRDLGRQLSVWRRAAELTQRQLAQATGYERTAVAHVEAGRRRADERFWTLADDLCRAGGALLRAYHEVEAAQDSCDCMEREARRATARAEAAALRATAALATRPGKVLVLPAGYETLTGLTLVGGELADRLMGVLARLRYSVDRRTLLQVLTVALATVGVSLDALGLDPDEQERVARVVVSPRRVDAKAIDDLETMLAACKRQGDVFGPHAVLHTLLAQRDLARGLVTGCPAPLRPRLLSVYSGLSCSAGFYYVDMGDPGRARRCFDAGRAAAHNARSPAHACYASCQISSVAGLSGDVPTALDMAAVAVSLGARTDDVLLRALADQMTAGAFALDGKYAACLAASERAQDALAAGGQASPESPAYWLSEGFLLSQRSDYLLLLDKPEQAADAANAALGRFDKGYVSGHAKLSIRCGMAQLRCGRVEEAAQVLGDAARFASQSPSVRLTRELCSARAQMQRWRSSPPVKSLDEQLAAYGFVVPTSN